jgi:methionyl-tRNA formyltransferase
MRIVFVGTGYIGVPTLRALLGSNRDVAAVVAQPDKPVGRDQRVQAPVTKQIATAAEVRVFQPSRIKDPAAIEQIRAYQPDVIVVMAYGQILPKAVLQTPRLACLNLHASLLPRWRGAAPIQAAIAAGDAETGITVMYMDEGLDTGDILLQAPTKISDAETGGTLHDRLAELAPEALLRALGLIETGKAPRVPQDSVQATHAPKLNRESGRIDWSAPADVIERRIRAFNPWPGAFTELTSGAGSSIKLKVFAAAVVKLSGKAGQILRCDTQLIVAAGEDALSLTEIQLEGRKRMRAAEVIRGNQWITGATISG